MKKIKLGFRFSGFHFPAQVKITVENTKLTMAIVYVSNSNTPSKKNNQTSWKNFLTSHNYLPPE